MPRSRALQAEAAAVRYRSYLDLCASRGVEYRRDWSTHLRELTGPSPMRRLTREELRAWWLARYTLKEICEMAGAIEYLRSEEAA